MLADEVQHLQASIEDIVSTSSFFSNFCSRHIHFFLLLFLFTHQVQQRLAKYLPIVEENTKLQEDLERVRSELVSWVDNSNT